MNLNSEHTAQNYRSLGLPLVAGFIHFKEHPENVNVNSRRFRSPSGVKHKEAIFVLGY